MNKSIAWILVLATIISATSCSKKSSDQSTPTHLATLGLYEYSSSTNKRIFLPVTAVGTQSVSYYTIFDTGSTGMTMDANGILPASMITASGITFTGDSTVIYGITIKAGQLSMLYGDQTSSTKVSGYLAYATVTLGDNNGMITTRRIPFFLYYKIVTTTVTNGVSSSTTAAAHSADVFGVGPGTSYASTAIASPLSYFTMGTGQTSGFRLAMLNSADFTTTNPTFVAGLLSIGLISSDLNSSGFIMHPFGTTTSGTTTYYTAEIPGTITYGSTTVTGAKFLFDTGTPSQTIIENTTAGVGALPVNTVVKLTTNQGFTYTYTTASTSNLTAVQNPNNTGDYRTIFSLDFFVSNEYLTDYTNHQIGLKNN